MPDKKYLKKVEFGGEDLHVKDDEAVSTINGKSNTNINNGTVTFADTAITEAEIEDVLGL